jgi:hypothetical protein
MVQSTQSTSCLLLNTLAVVGAANAAGHVNDVAAIMVVVVIAVFGKDCNE